MSATTTSLQELPQCEEDSFISDDPDDKFYDDNIYNWEVMFETVKFFLVKEGRWPRCAREEDKREVVLADGKPVLRDLAMWMHNRKTDKSNGKLIPFREEKLNSIGFPFHDRNKRRRQADPGSIITASRKKKRTISDYL